MKSITILMAILLSACGASNDELIKQHKQCQEAGMDEATYLNGLTYEVQKIVCVPFRNNGGMK